MKKIELETLRKGLNYIDEEYGALMCKSAIVALISQGHKSGTTIKIDILSCKEYEKDARKER